ncbi:MAG TPA: hypothetical protein VLZ12_05145 [Verrucomicrobiae bacterium]|nr:hypothetical protein [Verrucomicrobiae bacterium]
MKFAKRIFLVAGVYGILVLLPQYFLEEGIAADDPPAITHHEYFYGFIGIALAWQTLFLLIARDPIRYRLAMLPAVLEKFAFGGATPILFFQHRVALPVLAFSLVDLVFAVLFVAAFRVKRRAELGQQM